MSQKGDEYYFCENILVEYAFCENIVHSEGYQTKPAEDNVHIPQTNVFNVKQFNQNSPPQNQSHFESFKLNVVKRRWVVIYNSSSCLVCLFLSLPGGDDKVAGKMMRYRN